MAWWPVILSRSSPKVVKHLNYDGVVGVFVSPEHAVVCALAAQSQLGEKNDDFQDPQWDIAFRIGLTVGQPR